MIHIAQYHVIILKERQMSLLHQLQLNDALSI